MSFVTYEVNGAVATLSVNRPEALNALNTQVLPDIETVRAEMYKAAAALDFERAAQLRDQLLELESLMGR